MQSPLGRTLVIANPLAHSGKGAQGAEFAHRFLESYESVTDGFELILTKAPGEAQTLAQEATSFSSIIALGGDGIIHEVVNGLMAQTSNSRPALGILPMGSGNDFARTLGITRNDVGQALAQLVKGHRTPLDLGHVTSDKDVQGTYFMETLSFGLDAAIALDTSDKRRAGTTEEGEQLYVNSGLKILSSGSQGYPCTFSFDDGEEQEGRTLIFAVQNGPTYGGGFKICPAADLNDGLLDICYNLKIPSLVSTMLLFGRARFGKHVSSPLIKTVQAHSVHITFTDDIPLCQTDGEEFLGTSFDIDVVPHALDVIVP